MSTWYALVLSYSPPSYSLSSYQAYLQCDRFVDGREYFSAVARAIENAKEEIYIAGIYF